MSTLAIGCWLGAFTSEQALGVGVQPLHFARRLFGREAVEYQVGGVQQYFKVRRIRTNQRRPSGLCHPALATLMPASRPRRVGSDDDRCDRSSASCGSARSQRRSAYFRLARALHRLGLLPRRIPTRVYTRDAGTDVDPQWAAWCARWRATSTFAPKTAQGIYYLALRAGRWLGREHPHVRTPEAWTRDMCIAYVASVNDARVGDLPGPNAYGAHRQYPSAPLRPRSKATIIRSLRLFFPDLQEWGWCPRSFDPQRALATPRSIRALIGPDPHASSPTSCGPSCSGLACTSRSRMCQRSGDSNDQNTRGRCIPLALVRGPGIHLAVCWTSQR